VVSRNGRLLTLDHRRLYSFQKALPKEEMIVVNVVPQDVADRVLPESVRGRKSVRIEKLQEDRFGFDKTGRV